MCCSNKYMNARAGKGEAYIPTTAEHKANILTHGFFIIPSAAAMLLLVQQSHTDKHTWIAWVYGTSLILLFLLSTLFHAVSFYGLTGRMKFFFHLGDRAIIYVFIAASYTPWMMLKQHTIAEDVLCVTWFAAVLGVLYQYSFYERFKWLEIVFYLTIGIAPSYIILEMEDQAGVVEAAVGGAIYIIGIGFFKCDGIIPFAHAIWHCFVTAAASFHYYAVFKHLYIDHQSLTEL